MSLLTGSSLFARGPKTVSLLIEPIYFVVVLNVKTPKYIKVERKPDQDSWVCHQERNRKNCAAIEVSS